MADIKDVSQVIHSALEEIGVTGELRVLMDGGQAGASIGNRGSDDLDVLVEVHDLGTEEARHTACPSSTASA